MASGAGRDGVAGAGALASRSGTRAESIGRRLRVYSKHTVGLTIRGPPRRSGARDCGRGSCGASGRNKAVEAGLQLPPPRRPQPAARTGQEKTFMEGVSGLGGGK